MYVDVVIIEQSWECGSCGNCFLLYIFNVAAAYQQPYIWLTSEQDLQLILSW